ncbi:hypothetical protein F4777DRAFT_600802 [Nemania sp. FL0916]|nr:hypothetical protein F4777DRAFT_600802 [Nemania sp. FL0916]
MPLALADTAFGLSVFMSLIGAYYTYVVFCRRSYIIIRFCGYCKLYYALVVLIASLSFLIIAFVFVILATRHGAFWIDLSWRFTTAEALLDAWCVIKASADATRFPQIIYPQAAVWLLETVTILIAPAVPNPVVQHVITIVVIAVHALWTLLSCWYWPSQRQRLFRLIASSGQFLSIVALLWTRIGFVVIFFFSSLLIFLEELYETGSPFSWFRGSTSLDLPPANEPRKYNIIFLGDCPERLATLRQILNWPEPNYGAGLHIYPHPTNADVSLASIMPNLLLADNDEYTRVLVQRAAAVVIVFNSSETESFRYAETLRGFREEQPVLLVSANLRNDPVVVGERTAWALAQRKGWRFTLVNGVEQAFEDILGRVMYNPSRRSRVNTVPAQSRWSAWSWI